MTTDLNRRRNEWEAEYSSLRDWQVLAGPFNSRERAQEEETKLARHHGCQSHHGGNDPNNSNSQWWVYGFNHDNY